MEEEEVLPTDIQTAPEPVVEDEEVITQEKDNDAKMAKKCERCSKAAWKARHADICAACSLMSEDTVAAPEEAKADEKECARCSRHHYRARNQAACKQCPSSGNKINKRKKTNKNKDTKEMEKKKNNNNKENKNKKKNQNKNEKNKLNKNKNNKNKNKNKKNKQTSTKTFKFGTTNMHPEGHTKLQSEGLVPFNPSYTYIAPATAATATTEDLGPLGNLIKTLVVQNTWN